MQAVATCHRNAGVAESHFDRTSETYNTIYRRLDDSLLSFEVSQPAGSDRAVCCPMKPRAAAMPE
jgi:hypothetical protein